MLKFGNKGSHPVKDLPILMYSNNSSLITEFILLNQGSNEDFDILVEYQIG